ncbi:MAG TPA: hypothetical protein VJN48_11055 [Terriglobales bacterium]|nr:hypothetical protein [Terriglobales bacterium]
MLFRSVSLRAARLLAALFGLTTLLFAAALAGSWYYVYQYVSREGTPSPPALPQAMQPAAGLVSPLQINYKLDLPGRGEIFPALTAGRPADYWPVAVLTISNASDRPVAQTVEAQIPGWSARAQHSLIVGPHSTQNLRISPELLPRAFANQEFRRATLEVRVSGPQDPEHYFQERPVFLHSAYDLYWGKSFSNAQFIARWVTPHDPAVLRLVAEARRYIRNGRMPGYGGTNKVNVEPQVRGQAAAIFQALRHSGVSYVTSIYTFGDFSSEAQRIRLPQETLTLDTANCVDVSVAFASAVENLGMDPAIVIVPGHAFAGVRLGPEAQDWLYLDLTVLPRGTFQQAQARAEHWLKKTPPSQVLMVDVAAARALHIYPIPSLEGQANMAVSAARERLAVSSE